ncbi:MAG: hypothetical protein LBQ33_02925 [Oscillospiraceae bacterium]|jgi:hypothetical protein|nr:hypothetical protein [Oscillospiraceae bacterium]
MLDFAIYGILIFFVLVGIVASIYTVMMRLVRPGALGRFVVVIPPKASEEEVASLICAARLRVGLMGDISRSEVVAIDCGMTQRCRLQCEAMCRELDHTKVLAPEEFLKQLTMHSE